MKLPLVLAIFLLGACYGWEYPRLEDIQRVESEAAIARLTIGELVGQPRYLNSVIEVEGVISHIVNKGGQPAISLSDKKMDIGLSLAFGPKEREPIKDLKVGDTMTFKGILVQVPAYLKPGKIDAAIVPR